MRLPHLKLMFQQLKWFSLLFLAFLTAQLITYIPLFSYKNTISALFDLSCFVLSKKVLLKQEGKTTSLVFKSLENLVAVIRYIT